MTSGPEMLMQAALKAFVPRETAEQVAIAIEGMLKDGTLAGIGSLVSDIQEIKRGIARLEYGQARIFAAISLHSQQPIHASGEKDGISGSTDIRSINTLAPTVGPLAISDGGEPRGTGGGVDLVGERSEREFPDTGDGYDRSTGQDRKIGEAAE